AADVMEAERVGRQGADLGWMRRVVWAAASLADGEPWFHRVAPPVARLGAAARRVFPFGLAGQAVASPRGLEQPVGELPRVGPTHVVDRRVVVVAGDGCAGLRRDTGAPL